jgi:hypothetical protein
MPQRRSHVVVALIGVFLLLACRATEPAITEAEITEALQATLIVEEAQAPGHPEVMLTPGLVEVPPVQLAGQPGDATAILNGLQIAIPEGSALVVRPEEDLYEFDRVDAVYEVPEMTPAQVLDYFRQTLPPAGYEVMDAGEDEIEFRGNAAEGSVAAGTDNAITRFHIEVRSLD